MSGTGAVTTSTHGDVAVITIDDGKANALTMEIIAAISAAVGEAESSATAVAIIGREGKFSAGFDLKVMTSGADNARTLLQAGVELGLQIFEARVPVVLGVTGHALAMGGILTVCADYRVGAEGPFKLGLNEVAIGMPVPVFGVELCRDRLAKRWFTRCIQAATLCSPAEAVDANFLDETAPPDEVATRAVAVAGDLGAAVNPAAFALTRVNCRKALADQLRSSLAADMALFDVNT